VAPVTSRVELALRAPLTVMTPPLVVIVEVPERVPVVADQNGKLLAVIADEVVTVPALRALMVTLVVPEREIPVPAVRKELIADPARPPDPSVKYARLLADPMTWERAPEPVVVNIPPPVYEPRVSPPAI